jgi:hypothetical protein
MEMKYRLEFEKDKEIVGCCECDFCYDCIGCCASDGNYKWNFDYLDKRPDWCPLVEVKE